MFKRGILQYFALSVGLFSSALLAQAQEDTTIPFAFIRDNAAKIFSGRKADYFYADGNQGEQISAAFEKPLSMITLGGNLVFISGCRAGNCSETGAAVIDLAKKETLAVEIRHYHCRKVRDETGTAEESCDPDTTIDSFVFTKALDKKNPARHKIKNALIEWEKKVGYQKKVSHYCRLLNDKADCN